MDKRNGQSIRVETRVVPVYVYQQNVRDAWALLYEMGGVIRSDGSHNRIAAANAVTYWSAR